MPVLRLDRLLAGQGFGSRKEVRALVRSGAVVINGKPAPSQDCKVDTDRDAVSVGGTAVRFKEHLFIMMNKPGGVVSASRDPREPTVIDLLPENLRRPGLFPAGRLDKDTEGLLLITDDGAFAHDILSPRKHVEKLYRALLDGPLPEEAEERFREGLVLEDGTRCLPARVVADGDCGALVTIEEGKYHQVKRMFAAVGRKVEKLKRLSMGGLRLDERLGPGCSRELTAQEVDLIRIR